jgi:hypothetical protein
MSGGNVLLKLFVPHGSVEPVRLHREDLSEFLQKQTKETKKSHPISRHFAICLPALLPSFASDKGVSSLHVNILFHVAKGTSPDNIYPPTMRPCKELTPFLTPFQSWRKARSEHKGVSSLHVNILFHGAKRTSPDNIYPPTMRQCKELTPFLTPF